MCYCDEMGSDVGNDIDPVPFTRPLTADAKKMN